MEWNEANLLVARAKCDQSLLFFTRLFFKELRGHKFQTNWHHKTICEALEAVDRYETTFQNVNIPPRHSKTELALNYIARGLGMNPQSNWFYITGSDELRSETSVRIRDIVGSELFKMMYGVELKKDQKSRNLWRTEAGGGLKTATISGQITGFGAGQMTEQVDPTQELINEANEFIEEARKRSKKKHRPFEGAIVMDDLNKMDDAEKGNSNNDKVNRLLTNTVLSRVNSEDTPFINIQQRAGEDDATATLLETFEQILPPDKINNLVLPVIINGEPLWKEKMSMERIEKQRTSPKTAHSFETQYMQEPTSPNDRPFHKSKLKFIKHEEVKAILKDAESCVSFLDSKDQGTDYYCHPFGVLHNGLIYIVDAVHSQASTEVTIPKSVNMMKLYNCLDTLIETNAMGHMVFKQIRSQTKHKVSGIHAKSHKDTRIANAEHFIREHMRFVSDHPNTEYQSYLKILHKFEYEKTGRIDDAPDATAGLASLCMAKFRRIFQ